MTDKEIEQVANECGMGLGIHPPPVLTDTGDGFLRYIRPKERTHYGESIFRFARAIELLAREEIDND